MLSYIQAKLLIVDDLPENLLALEALIKREDRTVYKALSADEALSLLLQHEFAMAIVDVQMPGMNGFALAELMRGTEKTKNIPIIFVSAAGRELNYAFKGYESGAVDFLHKPLDIHAVKSKVNVFVDLYRQSKAMKQQVEALEQARREQEALLQQLQSTQSELEQAVRMRDDFMSIVAHEVRTPLNGLILETQLRKMHLARDNAAAMMSPSGLDSSASSLETLPVTNSETPQISSRGCSSFSLAEVAITTSSPSERMRSTNSRTRGKGFRPGKYRS